MPTYIYIPYIAHKKERYVATIDYSILWEINKETVKAVTMKHDSHTAIKHEKNSWVAPEFPNQQVFEYKHPLPHTRFVVTEFLSHAHIHTERGTGSASIPYHLPTNKHYNWLLNRFHVLSLPSAVTVRVNL